LGGCPVFERIFSKSLNIPIVKTTASYWIAILLIGSCFIELAGQTSDPFAQLVEQLTPNVVAIKATFAGGDGENGFGFITAEKNGRLYLATAAHVVRGVDKDKIAQKIEVRFSNDLRWVSATYIKHWDQEDLALLELEKPYYAQWQPQCVDLSPGVSKKVRFIGLNEEEPNWVDPGLDGNIFRQDDKMLHFAIGTIGRGTSGAPLLSPQGIVGLITEDADRTSRALKITQIQTLFSGGGKLPYYGLLPTNTTAAPPKNKADETVFTPTSPTEEADALLQIRTSFENGDLDKVFKDLKSVKLPLEDGQKSILAILESRFSEINKLNRKGGINTADFNIEENRVRSGLLGIINDLETKQQLQDQEDVSIRQARNETELLDLPYGLISIKGGTFMMGCTDEQESDCYDSEKPAHQVKVSDFKLGKYEVTQAQWRKIMGNDPPELAFGGCDQCPVEQVSWDDIQAFLSKLNSQTGKNYRLPTEAEWEYAARGGNKSGGYKYAGSNTIGVVAWFKENSGSERHPVGGKRPNELGLYDMTGNVWEWCQDWYGSYRSGSQTNPSGTGTGSYRVLRGGGGRYPARLCRVSYRDSYAPTNRDHNIGFRLAL
jgi:formylglycine-generating enzyme required for sulfatase activity